MKIFALILFIAGAYYLFFADNTDYYQQGYSDGYAVGYNEACDVDRGTMISGDFSNTDYVRGYSNGQKAGKKACKNS